MTAKSSRNRKKILVIDDETSIITYLTAVLEDNGYATCFTTDPGVALASVREQQPDLITLDIMMPRQSGVALYKELRLDSQFRHIPIVFVSAFNRASCVGPESFRRLVPDERVPVPNAYLEKPVSVPDFLDTVATLLDSAGAGDKSHLGEAP